MKTAVVRKNIILLIIAAMFVFSGLSLAATDDAEKKELPGLFIFYSVNCSICNESKKELIPYIEKEFKGKISIEYRDIGDLENYKQLLNLEAAHKVKVKGKLPVYYFQGRFLIGRVNKGDMLFFIRQGLKNPLVIAEESPYIDIISRFLNFSLLAIISAGLIDGINPCAFTVIVFFISFLTLQGYRRKELWVIGLSFIAAVFLTYLLIGLGFFGFLYRLEEFWGVSRLINISIGVFSLILAAVAFYDFLKFQKTHSADDLILQLPKIVKNRIHSIIGKYYRRKAAGESVNFLSVPRLIIAAFTCGFLVSLLEAVCTGQVYLPTITLVLKTSQLKLQAFIYLLAYNLMFILPLFAVFLFALWGASSEQFGAFLKKHLGLAKILISLLFFILGIFLIWRA